MAQAFVITRDPRGAQVHVRRRDTGECVGCIEAGLYEIVRAVIEEELAAPAGEERALFGGNRCGDLSR